jgi:hypothetical protein
MEYFIGLFFLLILPSPGDNLSGGDFAGKELVFVTFALKIDDNFRLIYSKARGIESGLSDSIPR